MACIRDSLVLSKKETLKKLSSSWYEYMRLMRLTVLKDASHLLHRDQFGVKIQVLVLEGLDRGPLLNNVGEVPIHA